MERTIISLDYAIKNVLRDKANFDILSGFLTELLRRKVVVQEVLESEANTEQSKEKVGRLDLKAKIDGGEIAVFEFQFHDQIDFFGKILFNVCKAVVEQVSRGESYDIKKVYSVNVAYFGLGNTKEYVFRASLTEFQGVHFDEKIPFSQQLRPEFPAEDIQPEYYLILPKKYKEEDETKEASANTEKKDRFDEWVYVLKNSAVKSNFTAAGIQEAGEKLDVMKMTPQQRADYEYTRRTEMDKKTQLYTAELRGKEIGIQEGKEIGIQEGEAIGLEKGKEIGIQEGREQTVLNAYKKGRSIGDIAEFTGLAEDRIIQIVKKHNLIL
jgi:predicted transposase/invertase (TIGR01784 family)